jgi:transcriptional regulator with XRE-family HTH domain
MVAEAFITPHLLRWARKRDGLSPEHAAKRIGEKLERFTSWEAGNARPTFDQARQLADILHVPFGYLFLSQPPKETLPLPDLRTVAGKQLGTPSPAMLEVLNDALFRQQWYREYREEEGADPLPFFLVTALAEGRLSQREAARLLNVQVSTLDRITEYMLDSR